MLKSDHDDLVHVAQSGEVMGPLIWGHDRYCLYAWCLRALMCACALVMSGVMLNLDAAVLTPSDSSANSDSQHTSAQRPNLVGQNSLKAKPQKLTIQGREIYYILDWYSGFLTVLSEVMTERHVKSSFSQLRTEAWEQGLSDFYALSHYLYQSYYPETVAEGPSSLNMHSSPGNDNGLVEAGGGGGDVDITEVDRTNKSLVNSSTARDAANRASRYVFSSRSHYNSAGKVEIHLSARIAPVLARIGDSKEGGPITSQADLGQQADKQIASDISMLFRFQCDVRPTPYLRVFYGDREIYSPELMDPPVYQRQLMGSWVRREPPSLQIFRQKLLKQSSRGRDNTLHHSLKKGADGDEVTPEKSSPHLINKSERSRPPEERRWFELSLQCTDREHVYRALPSRTWEDLPTSVQKRWALSGQSYFLVPPKQ